MTSGRARPWVAGEADGRAMRITRKPSPTSRPSALASPGRLRRLRRAASPGGRSTSNRSSPRCSASASPRRRGRSAPGGTRFGRFPGGGEPRTTVEKLDDIAALNAVTGANRTVSLHVPWDDPDDPAALRAVRRRARHRVRRDELEHVPGQRRRRRRGGEISYKFGSLAHSSPDARKRAVEHNVYCIELGEQLGSTALTVWLADGINHPGQADFRRQFERVADGLREIHDALPDGWRMFTEHKPYEPAFYSSVNADWGSSLLLAQHAGERAACLVDLGHHLPNTNIEQVVSRLAMVGRLGGFHFNDSKYGDDDLTVGSIHPYQFFLIVVELFKHGGGRMPDVAYMIDASHNLKDPLEDMIQATDQIQVTVAQAALARLRRPRGRPGRQRSGDRRRGAAAGVPQRRPPDRRRGPPPQRRGDRPAARPAPHRLPPGDGRRARLDHVGHRSVDRRPAGMPTAVAAVDFGATSIRVCRIDLDVAEPELEIVHRYAHHPVADPDGTLRWDWDRLVAEMERGLERRACPRAVGVDRRRHLGGRLRTARRLRRARRTAGLVPRRAHRRVSRRRRADR